MQKLKKNSIYILLAYVYRCTRLYVIYLLGLLFRIFPIDAKKVVVCSYIGNDYCDNPKYIIEQIINKYKREDIKIIWALNKKIIRNSILPSKIKKVKYESIRYLYELATAKVWVDNTRKMFMPLKRKNQYYFQTWHGAMPLKKVELDTKDSLSKIYVKCIQIDNINADYFISGSKWMSHLYRTAFNYNGKIIEKGIPRDDIFFNKKTHNKLIEKVYTYFNIPKHCKIIIYAPTFRDNKNINIYNWNYTKILKKLKEKYKKDFVMLIRLHPNVANKANKMNCFNKTIINATSYPDMQELLIAAEFLITDYSSAMFDFGMMNKKCLLHAPDINNYLKEREFYFDIKNLPFPLSENEQELESNIVKFNEKDYNQKLKKFYDIIGICETGNSAKFIANKIIEVCDNHEKK